MQKRAALANPDDLHATTTAVALPVAHTHPPASAVRQARSHGQVVVGAAQHEAAAVQVEDGLGPSHHPRPHPLTRHTTHAASRDDTADLTGNRTTPRCCDRGRLLSGRVNE